MMKAFLAFACFACFAGDLTAVPPKVHGPMPGWKVPKVWGEE